MLASHLFRCARLFLELTHGDVAKLLKVTREHVTMIEAGKHPPGRVLAAKIQVHFGVAIECWPAR